MKKKNDRALCRKRLTVNSQHRIKYYWLKIKKLILIDIVFSDFFSTSTIN